MTYESNKYVEFFEIDEGYYPEINESSIKDPKNKWQKTFPHKDIVILLKMTERALSRADKKSIWLEGSYGTGKSRIIWMLRNLFSCSEEEFDAYFDGYENLRDEIDLRARLLSLRRKKVVTVSRYATGDITSTQKLIFAVFESLTAALKSNGCKFDGAKTLRGKIVGWLESDEANLEMFRAKIRKPEYRMSPSFAGWTAEELIERLKNPKGRLKYKTVVQLCLGMHLHPILSDYLIKQSGVDARVGAYEDIAYKLLLTSGWRKDIREINEELKSTQIDSLAFKDTDG
mgnify:CR=1 FL=1